MLGYMIILYNRCLVDVRHADQNTQKIFLNANVPHVYTLYFWKALLYICTGTCKSFSLYSIYLGEIILFARIL